MRHDHTSRGSYHKTPRAVEIVAKLFGVSPRSLIEVLQMDDTELYRLWWQDKSDGGVRPIHAPVLGLRAIQKSALRGWLEHTPTSPIAHGGIRRHSIITNALPHLESRSMLHLDLANAFGQVNGKIPFTWNELGLKGSYPTKTKEAVWCLMERLLMVRYLGLTILPQGAPTSPAIFNRFCRELDRELEKFANRVGGVVTRFCDNIVFSWSQPTMPPQTINAVRRIIEDRGILLNDSKQGDVQDGNTANSPLRLPGVNIIEGQLRLDPKTIRRFRGLLYRALKFGDPAVVNGIVGNVHQMYGDNPPNQLAKLLAQAKQQEGKS